MDETTARLNITHGGMNGDAPDPVPYDATDEEIRVMAEEMIRGGYIPGIRADEDVDLTDFVVDRFDATPDIPTARLAIRPKTPFGL